ncbi:MAG: TraM recognition domain-containing protein [Chloroflexota bacterium]
MTKLPFAPWRTKREEHGASQISEIEVDGQIAVASTDGHCLKLLKFSPHAQDSWNALDSYSGTAIFGITGSAKTTGSGAAIACAMLEAGYGGCVFCAKPEEAQDNWIKYCTQTDRLNDMVIISPDQPYRFDFINYELNREGRGAGQTENLVALLSHITEIAEGKAEQQGGEAFWGRAMKEMLRNAIDLLSISQGRMTLEEISHLIVTAPHYPEQHQDEKWRNESFCWQCLQQARSKEREGKLTAMQCHDFRVTYRYWMQTHAALADRTRSGIVATFTSIADMFLHGVIRELFCSGQTNLEPDETFKDGKIIIVDLPIQEYHDVGRICQGIFKYMFQRAVLRRDVKEYPRPVFLWADEAQNFISKFDFRYQAVARSARAATVYLTQNISNYRSVLGAQGKDEAHAFLGNLKTQIFHAQGDAGTNQYASEMISQRWMNTRNFGMSNYPQNGSGTNAGASEGIHPKLLPSAFTTLRQGGLANDWEVDAIVFQSGRVWEATGDTYLPVVFKQKF